MPELRDWPCQLMLYATVKNGNAAAGNVTEKFGPTWRRSIRSKGGYWIGTVTLEGDREDLFDAFAWGLMFELREMYGGDILWQGFCGQMELTYQGMVFVKAHKNITNRVQCIYSRIGNNQLTNGSVESGAWAAIGTPTTCAQSTTWVSDKTYSCKIVTDAIYEGATIQSGIAIVAAKAYDARVSVNLVSGTWELIISRDDTGATLASSTENTVGQVVMRTSLGIDNTYAGNVTLKLICNSASGEIYGDAGVFQTAPERAETSWYSDTDSQAEYGIRAIAMLEAGLSDQAANLKAQTQLMNFAWPVALPPTSLALKGETDKVQLKMTFLGYAYTLDGKYTPVTGTDAASDHVAALIADAEFVTAGIIDTNAADYQIDDRAPLNVWEVLLGIGKTGDNSRFQWDFGVWAGRQFNYTQRSGDVAYHMRGGYLYEGGEIVEPWTVMPGIFEFDDMPTQPQGLSGAAQQSPRRAMIEEVEFNLAEWLKGGSGLTIKREKTIFD